MVLASTGSGPKLALGDRLHARGPSRVAHAPADAQRVQADVTRGGGRQRCVVPLEVTQQAELGILGNGVHRQSHAADAVGFFEQDRFDGLALRHKVRAAAGFEDPGLFAGDGFDGVAQEVLVIQADLGNQRHGNGFWWQDVGRVQTPTQTGLQQHEVGRRLGEGEEGRGRRQLKEGSGHIAVGFLHARQHIEQSLVGNDLTVQLNPLGKAHEVRAGVDVDRLASGLQHGLEKSQRRALAVGACDVNHRRHPAFGPPEVFEQRVQPVERQVDQFGMKGEETIQGRLDPSSLERHS